MWQRVKEISHLLDSTRIFYNSMFRKAIKVINSEACWRSGSGAVNFSEANNSCCFSASVLCHFRKPASSWDVFLTGNKKRHQIMSGFVLASPFASLPVQAIIFVEMLFCHARTNSVRWTVGSCRNERGAKPLPTPSTLSSDFFALVKVVAVMLLSELGSITYVINPVVSTATFSTWLCDLYLAQASIQATGWLSFYN